MTRPTDRSQEKNDSNLRPGSLSQRRRSSLWRSASAATSARPGASSGPRAARIQPVETPQRFLPLLRRKFRTIVGRRSHAAAAREADVDVSFGPGMRQRVFDRSLGRSIAREKGARVASLYRYKSLFLSTILSQKSVPFRHRAWSLRGGAVGPERRARRSGEKPDRIFCSLSLPKASVSKRFDNRFPS